MAGFRARSLAGAATYSAYAALSPHARETHRAEYGVTHHALFEALLRNGFDALEKEAEVLATADSAADALVAWLRQIVAMAHAWRGVIAVMVAAIDPDSALHESCVAMKAAGTRLLARAQAEGTARSDIDGADLFALVGALAWLGDQPALAPRADHLFSVIAGALLTPRSRT